MTTRPLRLLLAALFLLAAWRLSAPSPLGAIGLAVVLATVWAALLTLRRLARLVLR